MKSATSFSLLALAPLTATAATLISRAAQSISSQCTGFEIRQNWFVATCKKDNGATLQSAVYLHNKFTNSDGSLLWQADGLYFLSCDSCSLSSKKAQLTCACQQAWPNDNQKPLSTVDLEEHIKVYDGHLLSDLTGPPIIPASDSPYPIPPTFSYSISGNATCPTSSGGDNCNWAASGCDASNKNFQKDGPLLCYNAQIYFPDIYQFSSLMLTANDTGGQWELTGYPDEQCQSAPVAKIGWDQVNTCSKGIEPRVKGIAVKPLFNGDAR